MSRRLEGQVAVVTGAGRGIGRGIARSLLEEGAKVVISQRSAEGLDQAAADLEALGPVSSFPCDVSDREQVHALCDHAIERFGGLDVLVANAGVSFSAPFLELAEEDWDTQIAINLKGVFLCGQAAAQRMVDAGTKGRIVLISSICAAAAEPDCAHYNASKGGVSALCKSMALDLAPYGIVTNAIAPGWILSTATESIAAPYTESGERFPLNPIGRIGLPEDIGGAVAWLADPRTTFVSGAVITIDGAQTAALGYLDE
jgi:NAD(P)-dependent dehydrogenase (short-subunit alcohol dehydrogenase family)